MKVERKEFLEYLEPYKEDSIYLEEVEMDKDRLEFVGIFNRGRYPYSKNSLDYLAASEAVLFLTQFAYVISGICLRQNCPESKGMKLSNFIDRVAADKVHLTRMDMKFRKKIEKTKKIVLKAKLDSVRRLPRAVHIKVFFNLDESFFGSYNSVMLL